MNCMKEMKNRVSKICHPRFLKRSMKKLFGILLENGYPKSMISKLVYLAHDERREVVSLPVPEGVTDIEDEKK